MSGIFLQSTEGGEVIEVPLGKTVIGRGPFLQITDKRVSRSHAELTVADGSLYITPTHTNPCFLRRGGGDSQSALPKDEKCKLSVGDVFGLLPEQLFFTVCSRSGALNGTSVKVKNEPKSQTDSAKSTQRTQDKVKEEDPDAFLDEEEVDDTKPKKKSLNKGPAVVNVPGKHKMAMPLDKKRVLPDWMIRMAAIGPVPDKKKAKPTAKIPAVAKRGAPSASPRKRGPAKRSYNEDDDDFDSEEEERRPQRRRPRPSRRAAAYDDDDDDDDDFTPRKRPQRAARESRGSYVEELIPEDEDSDDSLPEHLKRVKDDDSDFEIDEGGGDSGSDWESRGRGKKGKSTRGRAPAARRTPGRRGRPRRVHRDDDDDEDDDDEYNPDAYVPRPSKRRGGGSKRKKYNESEDEDSEEEERPRAKRAPVRKKKKEESSEEEEEEEDEREKKKAAGRKRKKDESDEEVDDGDDDGKPAKKKASEKKRRRKCQFGKKCYRKNAEHFESYCHPGDATFDESSEEDDDDKPPCAYGAHCYRTNPQHLKDYSHKKTPVRPQRKPARNDGKTSVVDRDEDDDGLPNTYDYNDSFIDDANLGSSESSESYGDPEEDSDYDPGDEDVKSLMKEAKGFVKKKKMRQPVGKKIQITD